MPSTDADATGTKKKSSSKGRAPAHQNTYAFRHNPKSKLTAQILATPIQHCCRRCHDKLLWRKTYRKYKPLTTPKKWYGITGAGSAQRLTQIDSVGCAGI